MIRAHSYIAPRVIIEKNCIIGLNSHIRLGKIIQHEIIHLQSSTHLQI